MFAQVIQLFLAVDKRQAETALRPSLRFQNVQTPAPASRASTQDACAPRDTTAGSTQTCEALAARPPAAAGSDLLPKRPAPQLRSGCTQKSRFAKAPAPVASGQSESDCVFRSTRVLPSPVWTWEWPASQG